MPVDRIAAVQLPVEDLERAAAFYRRLLAIDPAVENPDVPGGAAVFAFGAGDTDIYLQRPPAPAARPDSPIVVLQVAAGTDAAALLAEIGAAGGRITYRESANPDLLIVGLTDTEGNNLELVIPR